MSFSYSFMADRFILHWRTAKVGALQIDGIAMPLSGKQAYPLRTHTFILAGASLDGSETKIAVAALVMLADCKARINNAVVTLPALVCVPTVTPTETPAPATLTPTPTPTVASHRASPSTTRAATPSASASPGTSPVDSLDATVLGPRGAATTAMQPGSPTASPAPAVQSQPALTTTSTRAGA